MEMLDWLEGSNLEEIELDYFDWQIVREPDLYMSDIRWEAQKSANPHKKHIRDSSDLSIAKCGIHAGQFFRNYVKRASLNS